MPRRVSLSQARSKIRQAQSKQRQNVQKVNSAIRKYNNAVRQYNSARKRAIDAFNRDVRAYNSRVRANRARLESELRRLPQQTTAVRYGTLHVSVLDLSAAYRQLDNGVADPLLSDLAERDTANSVTLLNALLKPDDQSQGSDEELTDTRISGSLTEISPDLSSRWVGAVFALNPENPEAARHFCTSSREIISGIFEIEAPDVDVLALLPDCDITEKGTPTRRAKVQYCLERQGKSDEDLESFIDTNIKNITILMNELNSGTHGPAGKFSLSQLVAIKTRVEDCIEFMCEVVS